MKDKYVYIEDGGWHFNALGGIEKKIMDFKHPVYTKNYMVNRAHGEINETGLPSFIINNKERYKHLIK